MVSLDSDRRVTGEPDQARIGRWQAGAQDNHRCLPITRVGEVQPNVPEGVERTAERNELAAPAVNEQREAWLGIESFEIVRQESGNIPITDRPFPRRLGQRVMSIGARAGRIKPTTGYAFTRIQEDSAAIVSSLQRNGHPFDVPADPYRYRLSDSILLEIMEQRGRQIRPIFEAMFRRNKIGRIFRFLDEVASPWEQLAIRSAVCSGSGAKWR